MNEHISHVSVIALSGLCLLLGQYLYRALTKNRRLKKADEASSQSKGGLDPATGDDCLELQEPITADEDSRYLLARLYHDKGQLSIAETYYRQALKLNPANLSARIGLANIFAEQERFDKAVAIVINRPLKGINAQNIYELLGEAMKQDGNISAAIGIFNLGIERGIHDYGLYASLANACHEAARYHEALDAVSAAFELATDDILRASCLAAMASCAFELEDYDTAAKYADKSLSFVSIDYDCAMILGKCLVHLQRKTEAIGAFRKMTCHYPNHAEPFRNLGIILGDVGRLKEALPCLKQALWLNPEDKLTNEALSEIYELLGDNLNSRKYQVDSIVSETARSDPEKNGFGKDDSGSTECAGI